MSEKEKIAFLSEIAENESLKKDFIAYKNTVGIFSFVEQEDDAAAGRQSYDAFHKKVKGIVWRSSLKKLAACAAALIFLGLVAGIVYQYRMENAVPRDDAGYNVIRVPAGQRVNLVLNDGTEIWINARSTLKYPANFNSRERRIVLEGEAFFCVAKNMEKPFIVSTSNASVKALGTSFNINGYAENNFTDVSLVDGSVEVSVPKGKQQTVLKPGERLRFNHQHTLLSRFSNENAFLWKQGIFYFETATLAEICASLKLYYGVEININNPKVAGYRYTGRFRQRDGVFEILAILQKIHTFKLTYNEKKTLITLQ